MKTLTPNFKEYQARVDGGEWQVRGESLTWNVRLGTNRLEVKTVNLFGVAGPVSSAEVEVMR